MADAVLVRSLESMDPSLVGKKLLFIFVPFLVALSVHEMAHALVAFWRGDNTAKLMGRVTLNPLPHIDWIGTVVLPMSLLFYSSPLFFGWAKPVPVNLRKLRYPRFDSFLIALAGPASNVFLGLLGVVVLGAAYPFIYESPYAGDTVHFVQFFVRLNFFLALLNMIPLHPLDGGKVLAVFLPESINRWLEAQELMSSAVLFLVVLGGGLSWMAGPVMNLSDALIQQAVN